MKCGEVYLVEIKEYRSGTKSENGNTIGKTDKVSKQVYIMVNE